MIKNETCKYPWASDGKPSSVGVPISNIPIDSTAHRELRKALRESLREGKTIMIAKTDRYRRAGKTTTIANYMTFVEDACLLVPNYEQGDMYIRDFGISKERIIIAKDLGNIIRYTKSKHFVMDEIPYKTYREIHSMVRPIKNATLGGIVTIYEDYLVL